MVSTLLVIVAFLLVTWALRPTDDRRDALTTDADERYHSVR